MRIRSLLISAALSFCFSVISTSGRAEAATGAPAPGSTLAGKVVDTVNAAGYTYVELDTGAAKLWVAAPEFAVKKGDAVQAKGVQAMEKYHSKTLMRTFDVVYFTGEVAVNGKGPEAGAQQALPQGHPPLDRKARNVDLTGIKKAENGQTVGEVIAGKDKLAGKEVVIRARVVKFNPQILGKNWMHVRDGSGAEGANELTVTSNAAAAVGDLVLIKGILHTNRDFGSGYSYGLIIEDASVTVEH